MMSSSPFTDIAFVLKPTPVPEYCLLSEVLAWCAFRRIPIDSEDWDGIRSPMYTRVGTEAFSAFNLTEEEFTMAGLPAEAAAIYWSPELKDLPFPPWLSADQVANWRDRFNRYLEDFKLGIISRLREGKIVGAGVRAPTSPNDQHASEDTRVRSEPMFEPIQSDFWTMDGVDWERSAVANTITPDRFTWVRFRLQDVFQTYPLDLSTVPRSTLYRVGGVYIDGAGPSNAIPPLGRQRGRPSKIPWEHFHLEMASLVHDGTLPAKMEAAIEDFIKWFYKNFDLDVGRTAISERLRPYYHRFVHPVSRPTNDEPENLRSE
jgi:hypothetical protein